MRCMCMASCSQPRHPCPSWLTISLVTARTGTLSTLGGFPQVLATEVAERPTVWNASRAVRGQTTLAPTVAHPGAIRGSDDSSLANNKKAGSDEGGAALPLLAVSLVPP